MNKTLKITRGITITFLLSGLALFLFSGWNLLVNKSFVPYLQIVLGSAMILSMFLSLTIAKFSSKFMLSWVLLAIFNTLLILSFYYFPELIKELYPLTIWIFLTILIASLQQVLDRTRKKYHIQMRIFNFGLIISLIPLYLLKAESPLFWQIFSYLSLFVMLANIIVFLLPAKK
jgi:hypothetical protein